MAVRYVFVLYDVKENRVNKVNKIISKYLFHEQNSVFRGEITEPLLLKLKNELNKIIHASDDKILFLEFSNKNAFKEFRIGEKLCEDNIL